MTRLLADGLAAAGAVVLAVEEVGDLVQIPNLGGIGSAALIALLIGTAARLLMSDRADRRVDKRWQEIAEDEREQKRAAERELVLAERDNARLRATLVAMGVDPGPVTTDVAHPAAHEERGT